MTDPFDIQDILTGAIISGVDPQLGAHERVVAWHKPTGSLTA